MDTIKATGPISFATYMSLCLAHPTEGYYMNPSNHVFGSRGDFTTSPEISQVFGELVAIWLVSQWMNAGQPPRIRVIELGPGRGTLMDDILRVLSQFPASRSALKSVHLVETSSAMRASQKEKLLPASQTGAWELLWHNSIEEIPSSSVEYTMLVAHEFFDALPMHLVEKTHQGWREVLISSTPDPTAHTIITTPNLSSAAMPSMSNASSSTSSQQRLRRVLSPSATPSSTLLGLSSPRFQTLPVGARVEISPASFKIARKIGDLIDGNQDSTKGPGGSALIIDYGGDKAYGNSFRAFKDHKIVDVFYRPGECDLTANVDFAYLKEAVSDISMTHGPLSQATFLNRMGMQLRVQALQREAKSQERRQAIEKAANRLVDLTGMGREYQVLGIASDGRPIAGGEQPKIQGVWPFMDIDEGSKL